MVHIGLRWGWTGNEVAVAQVSVDDQLNFHVV